MTTGEIGWIVFVAAGAAAWVWAWRDLRSVRTLLAEVEALQQECEDTLRAARGLTERA